MIKRGKWLAAAAAGAMAFGVASPASAQSATADLLLKLKEKGILSDDEYQTLMAREQTQAAAPAPASPAATGQPTVNAQTASGESAQQAAAERLDDKKMVRMTDSGVGLQIGAVALKFSGSVNGFYVHESGNGNGAAVVGGLAGANRNTSAIRNGLLPGFLKVDVTTVQGGWDVGAHFGLYPGINSVSGVGGANSAGTPVALATAGIDFRQTYLTFGKARFGEIKIGRDIGLFGSDAILNDITLLAVGGAAGNAAPSNTSLGRIGTGYIYTDFQPQITYSSPKFAGFQVAAGVFEPLQTAGSAEVNSSPGFQAKLSYDMVPTSGGLGAHAWVSGITQHHDATGVLPAYTGSAIDVGAKLSYANFGLLGYYYTGSGVGTTGLFILSTSASGRKRDSDGFYVQGTAGFGKVTAGISYGESHLDLATAEVNPSLLKTNASWVGQLRYGLTSWVTLIGEYTHTKATAHNNAQATSDAIAAGGILFF